MTAAKAPKPWLSGFCGPSLDLSSHRRCVEHPRADGVPCACDRPGCPCAPPPALTVVPTVDPLADLTLDQAVDLFVAAAEKLNGAALGLRDCDWQTTALLLARLRAGISTARTVDSLLVSHIYRTGPRGETDVEGLGRIKVRRTQDAVRWDERGAGRAVIDAKMKDRGYEVPDDPMEVLDWLLEAASVDYFRKTALRAMHIDPADFVTSTPGNPAVDLPPRS